MTNSPIIRPIVLKMQNRVSFVITEIRNKASIVQVTGLQTGLRHSALQASILCSITSVLNSN